MKGARHANRSGCAARFPDNFWAVSGFVFAVDRGAGRKRRSLAVSALANLRIALFELLPEFRKLSAKVFQLLAEFADFVLELRNSIRIGCGG